MTSVKKQSPSFWIVVPAAGVGARMGAACPKQYLSVLGKTLIEHTLAALTQVPNIAGIYVAVGADDSQWRSLPIAANSLVHTVVGAEERGGSVLNALDILSRVASDDDWVLVHDAARPCICATDVERLIASLINHHVGGLLSIPVSDTIKKVHGDSIEATIDRSNLWQAQTPQMFRLGLLRDCLRRAIQEGRPVTDEASAVEAFGYRPTVVRGSSGNFKVTYPEDLTMAEFLLSRK